jgi:flagella basal body P-ring formation protein FlgA
MLSDGDVAKKGKRVVLIAEAEGFAISAVGELRENATVGSIVRVLNSSSKKQVTGVLVDEETVRVEF